MRRWQKLAFAVMAWTAAIGAAGIAAAQTKPEGEMRFALYVTVPPAWLDPGEAAPGFTSPFWVLYALHDAVVKPMPGQRMAPSLAESWSESPDKRSYEFKLRQGVKFHNGDPFTADDVVFSFKRAKGVELHQKVKEVIAVDPYTVRFVLHEPWPDFMTFYGTLASAASWITPKKYFEQVGADGFKKHPIGLGPYKFVSQKPGIEIVMEANEQYWRKVPSVKRLVFLSVPEGTTRLAMLKRGEADVAYLLEGQLGELIRNDPELKLVFSGGVATFVLDFFDMWDPKSPWADQRVRKAASLAIDRQTMSDADNLGASKPNGSIIRKNMEFALPIEPDPYDPAARQKAARGGRLPEGVRCRRSLRRAAVFRDRRGDCRLSRRDRHQDADAHDGTRRVFLGAGVEKAEGHLLLRRRGDVRQRLDPHVGHRAERWRLCLWRLARCRRAL